MAEIVCPRCTHPNSEAANYCSSCGFDLRRSLEEDTREIEAVDLGAAEAGQWSGASFVIKRGGGTGRRFGVQSGTTTIGRHPESDIFLDDVTVSRRHADVTRNDGAIIITDVGSLNGTYVNRERIESSETLRSGDEVQIGKFKMVFLTEDP